jgi:hypothetical protein
MLNSTEGNTAPISVNQFVGSFGVSASIGVGRSSMGGPNTSLEQVEKTAMPHQVTLRTGHQMSFELQRIASDVTIVLGNVVRAGGRAFLASLDHSCSVIAVTASIAVLLWPARLADEPSR